MALLSSSSSGRRGQTSSAIVIVFVLTIFGALNVNILGQSIALSYVPLIGVCLWPRYAIARWVGTILMALLLVYVLGWMSRGVRPHVTTLVYQALLATAAFPIVYLCRHFLLYFLDSDDRF